jgi:hypothetical protein
MAKYSLGLHVDRCQWLSEKDVTSTAQVGLFSCTLVLTLIQSTLLMHMYVAFISTSVSSTADRTHIKMQLGR